MDFDRNAIGSLEDVRREWDSLENERAKVEDKLRSFDTAGGRGGGFGGRGGRAGGGGGGGRGRGNGFGGRGGGGDWSRDRCVDWTGVSSISLACRVQHRSPNDRQVAAALFVLVHRTLVDPSRRSYCHHFFWIACVVGTRDAR